MVLRDCLKIRELVIPNRRNMEIRKTYKEILRQFPRMKGTSLFIIVSKYNILPRAVTMATGAKKGKRFAHAITGIRVHYRDSEHAYVY